MKTLRIRAIAFSGMLVCAGLRPTLAPAGNCEASTVQHKLGAGYTLFVDRCNQGEGRALTLTVRDEKTAALQTLDFEDRGPVEDEVKTLHLPGARLKAIYVPESLGLVNTQASIWAFNPAKRLYESVFKTDVLELDSTQDGFIVMTARGSCCSFNTALYRWSDRAFRMIQVAAIEARVENPEDEGKKPLRATCAINYRADPVTGAKRLSFRAARPYCFRYGKRFRVVWTKVDRFDQEDEDETR